MFRSPPASVLCSCGQHTDTFGDGSKHTRRHNGLAEVIFQALLVENRYVMREMRCNSSTGDFFHPDFLEGRPAYFNVTVETLCMQPLYVTKSALRAGAAAEASEEQKDIRHEDRVRTAGGLFYHLVVGTLGSSHYSASNL